VVTEPARGRIGATLFLWLLRPGTVELRPVLKVEMSTQPNTILEARQISFAYGATPTLRGISLCAARGEFLGIAGPNGAGKSTLLHLLTGYLKPDSGQVLLSGRDVAHMRRREAASQVAFVAQKSETVFSFTVTEMVLMGRQPYAGLAAFDTEEDFEIVGESLAEAGIAHLSAKLFDELSGGEQQLVLIARALAQRAPVVILDEPVSFLDVRHQWDVLNLLAAQRNAGKTVIATFHDLNIAARWCSRLVLIREGSIAAEGAPSEVLTAGQLEAVYGLPLRVESGPGRPVRVDFPQ
jgi:iron complex transport system ATP-binding protein